MLSGYIDGFLCACPAPTAEAEAFYHFVDGLLKWRDLRADSTVALYSSARTYDVLADTGSYPLWEPIAASLQAAQIRDVQAKDIVDLVHGLLSRAVPVEDVLGISDFLCEDGCCQVPWPKDTRPSAFDSLAHRMVVLMGLRRHTTNEEFRRHILLTRDSQDGSFVSINAIVEDVDGHGRDAFSLPVELQGAFPLSSSSATLWSGFDPGEICLHAMHVQNSDLLTVAIREEVRRRSADAGEWSMHPRFGDSLWALGGARRIGVARAVVRACAETILGQQLAATHHLRRGPGANEPQRVRARDGAGAWRRDVDHEFHLHYWDAAAGPELAAIVVHADMSIPD